jgi:hypothetical protein
MNAMKPTKLSNFINRKKRYFRPQGEQYPSGMPSRLTPRMDHRKAESEGRLLGVQFNLMELHCKPYPASLFKVLYGVESVSMFGAEICYF